MLVGSGVRRVAIVGGSRIPFARSHGAYARVGNTEMLTAALRGVVARFALDGVRLGEVAAGAVIKHSRDFNLARECVLSTTLDPHTPAFDLQRACGTSLEAAIGIANKIALGQIDAGIAAGVDSVSDPPVVYGREYQQILLRAFRARSLSGRITPFLSLRPRHFKPVIPDASEPRTGLSMGESCELMAKRWSISRDAQDALAYESHRRAAAAWSEGFFDDLVEPFAGLQRDDNIRPDTSLAKLSSLRASFDRSAAGTLTAGNSTPLTDGASAVLLASESWARARGLPILGWLSFGKAWAVDFERGDEGLLMAPAYAVPAMLADAGLTLQEFDYYEIHEAFAAQVLCTLAAWESEQFCRERLGLATPLGQIERTRLNVRGSSIAIGHPFAATGARILATLAKLLANDSSARRGLISVCTAGGMGVTAIVERA
ncbi:MAG: acetyl-CoA C-acetyltransferase [Gammaproteobacteria bacterium]|nr:acetyl-CoA C-acetyltransferase [Gammaproteobacteria bacterium]